jgi:quercetin dioxygenase-like cupin family protein
MPIIRKSDWNKGEGTTSSGLESFSIVDAARGSDSLRLGEVTIASMSRVPRHTHTNTEEAMILLEGRLDALVGSQRMTIEPGDLVLAPAGTVHGFVNVSDTPARLLFVFPIHEPDRVLSTPPNAPPSGFPSEQGLSGFSSPHDRPLERESQT